MRFAMPRAFVAISIAAAIVCVLYAAAGRPAALAAGRRPNVLLIYTDDHARWAVGAYGNEDVHTPHIDRLAAQGMRFTQAFTKPVCSPSRAMVLTGRYSHRLGIPDYIPYGNPVHAGNGLPAGTPTIASRLKSDGYTTGLIGKWHLGYGAAYYPERFGFDTAEGYRYVAPGVHYDSTGQIPYLIAGKVHEQFKKSSIPASDCTTILTERAVDFITSNRRKPFFLFLSYYRPHLVWLPVPDEDLAIYRDARLAVPEVSQRPDATVDEEKLREWMRLYYANITCVDRNLGRVLAALDALQLGDETIVVFIGDNGFNVGQHGLLGKGNARLLHADERGRISRAKGTRPNMFDPSVRVPMVVRWPGVVRPGSTCDALVSTIDVLPTLEEIRGDGGDGDPALDGRSLLPLLSGDRTAAWRDVYCDTYDMIYLGNDGQEAHMRMIRSRRWKLVLYCRPDGRPLDGGSRHELFDLRSDPGEVRNLYADPAAEPVRQRLEARLRAWMQQADVSPKP